LEEEDARLDGVRRTVGTLYQVLGESLPVRAALTMALERLLDGLVVGTELEQAPIRRFGLFRFEAFFVEHACALEKHRQLDGRSGVQDHFELEHPGDGVPLASGLVTSSS